MALCNFLRNSTVIYLYIFGVSHAATGCNIPQNIPVSRMDTKIFLSPGETVLTEQGVEVNYSFDQRSWLPLAMPTFRLGRHVFRSSAESKPLTVWLRTLIAQQGTVELRQTCPNSEGDRHIWFMRMQSMAEAYDYTVTALQAPLAEMAALEADAEGYFERSLIRNFQANQAYLRGDLRLAASLYVESKDLWRTQKIDSLELAAALGANNMFDRMGDYQRATAVAQPYLNLPRANYTARYFLNRFAEQQCQSHFGTYVAVKFEECLQTVLKEYIALGETAEVLNTLTNFAYVISPPEQDKLLTNKQLLLAFERTPIVPQTRVLRGRYYLMRSAVHCNRGAFADCLDYLERARVEFSNSTEEMARWLIYVHILAADIQSKFGLHNQAMRDVQAAIALLNVNTPPARAASIYQQLGENFRRAGNTTAAGRWFANARKLRSDSGLTFEAKVSQLSWLALQPLISADDLHSVRDLPALYASQTKLLEARALISAARPDLARSMARTALSQARSNALKAEVVAFLTQLPQPKNTSLANDYLAELAQTADHAPTTALAYLTVRSGESVRRAWVDIQDSNANPESVFTTVLRSNPARFMTSVTTPVKQQQLAPKQVAGEVGFLNQLTTESGNAPARFKAFPTPTLAAFQARLPANGVALLLVPGDKQSLALWVEANRVRVQLLAGRNELQAKVAALSALVATPVSSRAATELAARSLSDALFRGFAMESGSVPTTLWVLADELSGAIPFSTLYWPGQSEPMLQSTNLSFVTGLRVMSPIYTDKTTLTPEVAHLASPNITSPVFFAPSYVPGTSGLQSLDFAEVERRGIEFQMKRTLVAYTGKAANRHAFQDLLQTPGTWMHIAAHGRADPGVLGNAGLWLASNTAEPDFLSWLELGNMRTQAELMVLNACQSATGAQPSRQANVSFALAMSASGAENVVAALWPVSDVAAGTWIPAFYGNLAIHNRADQSGSALRQAQLTLYQSPHYRHPFYWASLVHFRRVDF